MPDLVPAKTGSSAGIQIMLKSLDSGLRRNDALKEFQSFFEFINNDNESNPSHSLARSS